MTRDQLEHIIRAASYITNEYEIVIIGSQSILGDYPNAPSTLRYSMEADVYPLNAEEKSDLIDGAIGEQSRFHEMYGYYAQGVSSDTAILPDDWKQRVTSIPSIDSVGYCIDVHDLAISKLIANREKDLEFIQELIKHQMIKSAKLLTLAKKIPFSAEDPHRIDRITNTFKRLEHTLILKDLSKDSTSIGPT